MNKLDFVDSIQKCVKLLEIEGINSKKIVRDLLLDILKKVDINDK